MPTGGRGMTISASSACIHFVIEIGISLLKTEYGFFFSTVQVDQTCLDEHGAEFVDITRQVAGRESQ